VSRYACHHTPKKCGRIPPHNRRGHASIQVGTRSGPSVWCGNDIEAATLGIPGMSPL